MKEKDQEKNLKDEVEQKKKTKKSYGKLLVLVVLIVISFFYYIYVFRVMINSLNPENTGTICFLLITFHLLLFMLLWSFYMTINTNPGIIPLYWGFYIGDDDSKRRRYCLICNAFKPERSHHCSTCNICVLNMDHHCPWVDNCIGFYNRKFFMILLFYVVLLTIYVDLSMLHFVIQMIKSMVLMQVTIPQIIGNLFTIATYLFCLGFSGVIANFYKFHIELVLNNSTTIENIDKEHEKEFIKYRLSKYENWIQVFGPNKLYWFIPSDNEKGRPIGDGLTWITQSEDHKSLQDASQKTVTGGSQNPLINNPSNPSVEMRQASTSNSNKYGSNAYNTTSPLSGN